MSNSECQITSIIGEAQLPLLVLFGQTRFDAYTERSATVEDTMVLLRHNYRPLPYPGCWVTKPTGTTKTEKRFETSFSGDSPMKKCVLQLERWRWCYVLNILWVTWSSAANHLTVNFTSQEIFVRTRKTCKTWRALASSEHSLGLSTSQSQIHLIYTTIVPSTNASLDT